MAVGDAHVFLGFLTPVLTQVFFPKPPTTFLTYLCKGERQKYPRKKVRLNRGSNSQLWGHESNMLTTELFRRGWEKDNLNPFPNYKIYSSKLKVFPDGNFKSDENGRVLKMNKKKTLWEKEKLLVTSNFFFSHSVLKRLVLYFLKNKGLFGKGLISSGPKLPTSTLGTPDTQEKFKNVSPLKH